MTRHITPPPPRIFVRLARLAGWNAALVLAGLALIALAGEAWLRLSGAFVAPGSTSRFVEGVGVLYEPHSEVRHTNGSDYWTIQRANSLGFLDREPPDPARAAASCHVAVFGDSFVEAKEVAIADKFHVRLEALAAAALPELDVTTSAWGRFGTAQSNQLPFHDEYARPLRPNLLVLVFTRNDFLGNSAALAAMDYAGWDPDRTPYAFPARAGDGGVRLRPPDPDYAASALPWAPEIEERPASGRPHEAAARELAERSLFARWVDARLRDLRETEPAPPLAGRLEAVSARPGYGYVARGWRPTTDAALLSLLLDREQPPPVFAEALEFTRWALAEFRRLADRDGASVVVLHNMPGPESRKDGLLREVAGEIGIPVINWHRWIDDRGRRIEDARFPDDNHWSPQGHRWTAEALLDWLRRHPEVCDDRARA